MNRPSRNEPSRSGASRKSSAERVGGVSTTIRSHSLRRRAAGRASPSPCTPACRRSSTTATGRRGWPGSAAARSGSACASDDLVEGPLHVQHHRVQLAAGRRVDARHRARGVVQLGQPQRLGQPAGRVDGQHHDRAARARRRAAPAPPRSWSCRRRRSRSRRRSGSAGRRCSGRRGRAPARCAAAALTPRPAARRRSASSYSPPRSTPSASSGSSYVGRPSVVEVASRSRLLQRDPLGVLGGLVEQRRRRRRPSAAQPGGRQPAAHLGARSSRPSAAAVSSAGLSSGARTVLTMIAADRQPGLAQLGDRVDGLLDRHLLQQRHQVHRGLRRAQQPP